MTYLYRHRLDPRDPNLRYPQNERARILRAAFTVADAAHAGESRGKIDPTIGYISHPLMVYDMLCKLGEKAPILLAAAFLHDVLELDHFRDDPERMQRELEVELEREGIEPARAQEIADEIYHLVYMVTNPEVLPKPKEFYQIDRVAQMDLRAKKLKIVDQAASLIDNRIKANDPEDFSFDKERGFKEKAESLVDSILASAQDDPVQREALHAYDVFFARVQNEANRLFLSPMATELTIEKHRVRVRSRFDFDALFKPGTRSVLPRRATRETVQESLYLYEPDMLAEIPGGDTLMGLLRVDYNAHGRVTKFFIHAPENEDADRMQAQLVKEVREKLRWAGVYGEQGRELVREGTLRPGDLDADDATRVFYLDASMPADAFAAAALNAHACDIATARYIASHGKEIAQGAKAAEHDGTEQRIKRLLRMSGLTDVPQDEPRGR